MKRQLKLYVIISFIHAAAILPTPGADAAMHPRGDGRLTLYSYHTDDVIEVTFRTDAGYDAGALKKINAVMRSRGDDSIHAISPRLIDLIDHLQDHFGAETIEIISGYRSKPFNEFLRASGRGAASESLHTKGLAADIHVDEVTEKALWEYAKKLGAGGAGYYPRHNFVHVDVGPRRIWREPDPKERILTGLDLNPNPSWRAITDKNLYAPDEAVELTITNMADEPAALAADIWYARFAKGRWSQRKPIERPKKSAEVMPGQSWRRTLKIDKLAFGKYRIVVFPEGNARGAPLYSSEFYIKKP